MENLPAYLLSFSLGVIATVVIVAIVYKWFSPVAEPWQITVEIGDLKFQGSQAFPKNVKLVFRRDLPQQPPDIRKASIESLQAARVLNTEVFELHGYLRNIIAKALSHVGVLEDQIAIAEDPMVDKVIERLNQQINRRYQQQPPPKPIAIRSDDGLDYCLVE